MLLRNGDLRTLPILRFLNMRIGALGDIHIRHDSAEFYRDIFTKIAKDVNVILLAGDLTHEGKPEEAELLKTVLVNLKPYILAVLGNHDYEKGQEHEIIRILNDNDHIKILDGDYIEIDHVGFAGSKGFGGGFDTHMLPAWGEQVLKDMVNVGIQEALALEKSLSELTAPEKIVLLHYSPIKETIVGESPEIYPFLGLTRLVEPINRYNVTMVFHGHAHNGTYEGKTDKGIPVYNVALPVLQHQNQLVSIHEISEK